MSLDKIVNGDYGDPVVLTITDVDTKLAADVSAYTTAQVFLLTDPAGTTTTKTAAFTTDGTNGKVQYTLLTGDINLAGVWFIRARVSTASAVKTSERIRFEVLP